MRLIAGEPARVANALPDGTRVQITVVTANGSVYLGHARDQLLAPEPYSTFAAGEFNVTQTGGAAEISWRGDLWLVSFGADCDVAIGRSGAPTTKTGSGGSIHKSVHGFHNTYLH